jgi:hypothetical protein
MAYVPPNRRKPKTEEQRILEMNKSPEKHFPSLGGNVAVASHSTISYGGKAKEWDQKRIESEENERINAMMAQMREEKRKRDEYDLSMTMHGILSRRQDDHVEQMPEQEAEPEPAREQDEWTVVKRKHKKTKKDLKFDEDKPEYDNTYDHLVAPDHDAAFDD